ncbi:MAG: aminotransferase class I/II-fold pyridoxal phosphate-dependent enzyme [Armatimonadota bacterium]|nr:aminotransferase class I/II-fold pyridoxal phosphate-dependent enzyme [Armatimonadota bacterium]
MNEDAWSQETICQHLGEDYRWGSVVPPIYQTSLFVFDSVDSLQKRIMDNDYTLPDSQYVYTRDSNPTTAITEQKIAALEGTEKCRLVGSGMAAISAAILACTQAGGHVIATQSSYMPTKSLLETFLSRFGIETSFVDGRDLEAVEAAIKPNTTLIYMESPGTFLFHIQDIRKIVGLAKASGLSTVIDNSYCSPIFQQPAKFGVDYVVHSATKYLGGHSDIIAGAICGSNERIAKLIPAEGMLLGAVLDPFAAWLMMRSLRTLPLRMERHQSSATKIAQWLQADPMVEEVFYPGLPSHEGHDLHRSQATGASGLLSFRPTFADDREAVCKFAESLELFQIGISWGGHESLVAPIIAKETDDRWIIRLSVGLEGADDLITDIERSLSD